MKRTAASRAAQLTSHASPFHPSVTLFEADEAAASLSETRRSKRLKVEPSTESDSDALRDTAGEALPEPALKGSRAVKSPSKAKAKAKTSPSSPRKPKVIPQSLKTPHPAPENWKETYDAIKDMRARITAPVDTMGCDQAQHKEQDPKNQRFATLVSLMLSSQTKDEVTDAAVSKLRDAVGGSLSVEALIATDDDKISDAICKVGFWRRKTGYLKQAAQRLHDHFDSDVPKTVDELCSLPGVGPKMAFLALHTAWNLNVGIGVDVHVHRITNRLKWHKPPTKNPEETRLNLQSWLPSDLHREINHLLVGFGQVVCLPVGPRCDQCTLSKSNLCPSAQKVIKSKSKKAISMRDDAGPKIEITVEESTVASVPRSELHLDRALSPLSAVSVDDETN